MEGTFFKLKQSINCNGKLLDLSVPKVMGIINITPDSFYAASRNSSIYDLKKRVGSMLTDGADIIDIGAYSSRPGAVEINEVTEWSRIEPVLEAIRSDFPDCVLSLDTFRSKIAQKAVEKYKVDIINDISSGNLDEEMLETISCLKTPYIMMHMKGTPKTMQSQTDYQNLVGEILVFFAKKIERLVELGAKDIIIDPGFGFAKTLDQNYELLARLNEFKIVERPILVGISRKSMIYKQLNIDAENALNGTTVLNTLALQNGASFLRVHDVKEAAECVKLVTKTKQFLVN